MSNSISKTKAMLLYTVLGHLSHLIVLAYGFLQWVDMSVVLQLFVRSARIQKGGEEQTR